VDGKMKALKDLGLCKKTQKKVEEWLQEWLILFKEQADYKSSWVYRANFEENDFFYFTDCKDILAKDPEAKGQENNLTIRSRKRKIMLQLFVKTLLGQEVINSTIKCSHCGFSPGWIDSLRDGTGHWTYCPKCTKLEVQVFPDGYDTCMAKIQRKLRNTVTIPPDGFSRYKESLTVLHGFVPPPPMKIDPKCKKAIEEIRAYKYEHVSTPKDTKYKEVPRLPKKPPLKTIPKFRYRKCKGKPDKDITEMV